MLTRTGNDTIIGFIPGSAVIPGGTNPSQHAGDGLKIISAFKTWAGWTAPLELGVYSYPNGGASEPWVWSTSGAQDVSIRSFAIPGTFTYANMIAGQCDAIWTARAQAIVAAGLGNRCRYFPGYEAEFANFNGSAGLIGDTQWAAAVSRQLNVMRQVSGFNPWVGINYHVWAGTKNGLNPSAAFAAITETFHSVDLDLYDQSFTASITDVTAMNAQMDTILNAQEAMAQQYGVPVGIGEFGGIWRADGHGGADRTTVIEHVRQRVLAGNYSHVYLFNGSNLGGTAPNYTGDNVQFATVTGIGGTGTQPFTYSDALFPGDAAKNKPLISAYIKTNWNPSLFIGRSNTTVATLQATITSLNAQIATLTSANATLTSQLATATQTGAGGTLKQLLQAYELQVAGQVSTAASSLASSQSQVATLTATKDSLTAQNVALNAALAVLP